MSRFCHNKGKKRSACHYDKRLDLHQLFEQILYIPLIVFSFLHQPIDTICLVPLLQELGERPIECGLPTLDHAAILLHGIRCFADRQPLGKAFPEEIGVVVEHRFERLLGKCEILTHGLICFAVGYADVLLPLPDEAGILADHNSFAGIDIFYHADNVDPIVYSNRQKRV